MKQMRKEWNYLYFLKKYLEVELQLLSPCITSIEKSNPDEGIIEILEDSYSLIESAASHIELAISKIENQLDQ